MAGKTTKSACLLEYTLINEFTPRLKYSFFMRCFSIPSETKGARPKPPIPEMPCIAKTEYA